MHRYIFAFLVLLTVSCSKPKVEVISTADFKNTYNQVSTETVLIDVRTEEEVATGVIEGAVNMNFHDPEFNTQLMALDKNKTYYLYCKSGGRSNRTAELMKENGFKEVYDLEGGITAWQAQGFPVVLPTDK
ncbi:hypothetical protein BFP72_06965 [Reichenbachiella sp. 5M10]|uniref:rhodanese-like domain-containing protein n=1 Tax=Reichenbachiella sp. 5M10 TaxID=1889772 RepID=UPI000C14D6B7|nr:rhodanese-like domain-containing protein [Reichenbachiella sp. 5M10]PIB35155.1 hypothetical protein BFP72_06965 [Reichenbachiella sp. 5M10]